MFDFRESGINPRARYRRAVSVSERLSLEPATSISLEK